MKKILLLSLLLLFARVSLSFANGASFIDSGITNLTGVSSGYLAWGDYDNDGNLDLAVCGRDISSASITKIYRNNGDDTFTDIGAGITDVSLGSLAWGDYDNDGDLDLAVCGKVHDDEYTTRIYRNDGGTFIDIEAGPTGVILGSLAWGDYDNDGDLDLALSGRDINSVSITKIYRNNGDDTFTDIAATALTGVSSGSLAWGDYDNDGDLDLAVCGYTDSVNITRIYRNDGGTFTDIGAGLTDVSSSSLAWGDYDNDGDLDLAVCGYADSAPATTIYQNTAGVFTDIGAGLTGVSSGSLAWGDYDNDGNLDLAVCGHTGSTYATNVYRNDGGGAFTDIGAGLTPVYYSSLAWGDYDNDGDLDLAVCGYTGSEYITKIYKNLEADPAGLNNPNLAPSPPTGLTCQVETDTIILKWNPGSDSETPDSGLYYNLRLGTTLGGNEIVSGIYGSPLLGNYLRPKLDGSQLGVRLGDLPSGTYYWNVQTIDAGLKASVWSDTASFVIGGDEATGDFGSLPVGPLAAGISAFLVWWKRRKQE